MDGGTVWDTDPISAVKQCLEVVENEEDIIVDIAICGPSNIKTKDKTSHNSLFEFFRSYQLHSYYNSADAIAPTKRAYPNVNYRYLFLESDPLVVSIDFRNETTWPYQMKGRQDAKNQLEAAKNGFNGFMTLEEWNENAQDVRSKYSTFMDYFTEKLNEAL